MCLSKMDITRAHTNQIKKNTKDLCLVKNISMQDCLQYLLLLLLFWYFFLVFFLL